MSPALAENAPAMRPSPGRDMAFVCHPYHRGGVTRWMVDAAVQWARTRDRAFFICPSPRYPFLSAGSQPPLMAVLDTADPARTVTRVSTPVGVSYELGTERYRASVFLRVVRASVPVGTPLILSDEPAIWRAASVLAADYPVIGVMHADDDHYYRLAEQYGGRVAALVGVSSRVVTSARRRAGVAPDRIHRIPCGIPLRTFPFRSQSRSGGRLIWVGRIEERQKRVSDLPSILLAVRARGVDATLDIVGDGPNLATLRRSVDAAGVATGVRWHGWSSPEDVQRRLAEADVLILPSNFEGMPVAVMEALAAGCGVVATAVSGLEDYATHPLAASCYRTHAVGDVNAAAQAVAELLALNAGERAAAARRLAEAEFAIERCMQRYADLSLQPAAVRSGRLSSLVWARFAGLASFPISAARRARVWLSDVKRSGRTTAIA